MYDILSFRRKEISQESFLKNIEKLFTIVGDCVRNFGWKYVKVQVSDFEKSRSGNLEELKKNLYVVFKVIFKSPADEDVIFPIYVPIVFDDYYFFLAGQYKIPIFQLIDNPVIYKKTDDSFLLRFKSNVLTASIVEKKKSFYLNVFGKNIPLHLLINYFYEKETIENFFKKNSGADELIDSIGDYLFSSEYVDDERCIFEIGEIFSKGTYITKVEEKIKRGQDILFSLESAHNIDFFTNRFLKNDFFLMELLDALRNGPLDDADIKNKRLRLLEYILTPLINRCYKMIIFLEKHPKEKFKISPSIILDNCISSIEDRNSSVGDIIRYVNILNPTGNIVNLFHCSLVGPGGFKKENVPYFLRDLHDSHMGYLCPADTPDRDGCGVLYNLVPDITVDEYGRFLNRSEKNITSYTISLVPFSQYDDPTRLQMASSQMKQSIPIIESEVPYVCSGEESKYIEESGFIKYAKYDGIVVYIDRNVMVVVYDIFPLKKAEVFRIGYIPLYLKSVDYIQPRFKAGEKFKKGDILCCSMMIKDEKISLGRNLFTVIMPYMGYNYEDGIVVSEDVVDKFISLHFVDLSFILEPFYVLLSLKDDEYKILKNVGETLSRGEVYARMKNLNLNDNVSVIYEEPYELVSPENCKIVDFKIFPNEYNKQISEFSNCLYRKIEDQMRRYSLICSSLEPYFNQKQIDSILQYYGISSFDVNKKEGYFYYKKQKINGTMFGYSGVYEDRLIVGDKISNRHGNKGIISKILPPDMMPTLPDGRRAEVILNPLGIISRMNVGQLMEMHLGEVLYQLKKEMLNISESSGYKLLIKVLNRLYSSGYRNNRYIFEKIIDSFNLNREKYSYEKAVEKLYFISPPFLSPSYEEIKSVSEFLPAFKEKDYVKIKMEKDGEEKIIKNPIAYGYMYFNKLVHRAEEKFSSRSIGPYNKKTLQPIGGRKSKGGHRFGEMEVWSLLAHNSKVFLKELMTSYSDSVAGKISILSRYLSNPEVVSESYDEHDYRPKSIRLMESYLNLINLTIYDKEKRENEIIRSSRKYMRKDDLLISSENVFGFTIGEAINNKER